MGVFIEIVLGIVTIAMVLIPPIFESRGWSSKKRNISLILAGITGIGFISAKAVLDKKAKEGNDVQMTLLKNEISAVNKDVPRRMDSLSAHRDYVDSINYERLSKSAKENGFDLKDYRLIRARFVQTGDHAQNISSDHQSGGTTAHTVNNYGK